MGNLSKEDIDLIAENVANRMAASMPANLTIGAKLGIAVGGFFGSCAHVAGLIPGAGQVCDFGKGMKWGFNEKLAQYQVAEQEAMRARAEARQAQTQVVMGRPRTFQPA